MYLLYYGFDPVIGDHMDFIMYKTEQMWLMAFWTSVPPYKLGHYDYNIYDLFNYSASSWALWSLIKTLTVVYAASKSFCDHIDVYYIMTEQKEWFT